MQYAEEEGGGPSKGSMEALFTGNFFEDNNEHRHGALIQRRRLDKSDGQLPHHLYVLYLFIGNCSVLITHFASSARVESDRICLSRSSHCLPSSGALPHEFVPWKHMESGCAAHAAALSSVALSTCVSIG